MTDNMSLISLRELTQCDSTKNGTMNDEEKVEMIKAVQSVIQTIQSRILFLQGKLWRGDLSLGGNVTQGNATFVENTNYLKELEHLWSVTTAVNLRTEMMKMAVFNNLSQSNPDISNLLNDPRSPFPPVPRFLGLIDEQKNLCESLERERQACLNKKSVGVGVIAAVRKRIHDNADSQIQEEELKRMMKMNLHIKCARAIINCLLVKCPIDFVANPELLDIKIRSRHPQIIRF